MNRSSNSSLRLRPYVISGFLGLSAILAGLLVRQGVAEPTAPQQTDRQVAVAVSALLRREHVTKHPLDKEISEKAMKAFIKGLDPLKLYFTKDDIAEFNLKQDELTELVKRGDVTFAYTVYTKFLARVEERLKLVDTLLAGDFDFSTDEEFLTDPEKIEYSSSDAEFKDKWSKRLKYDILVQKADGKKLDESKEKLAKRYKSFLKRMKQMSSDDLLEMYLTSMTTSFDPHTTYMSPSTLNNFEIQMRLKLDGIGASLQYDDGNTIVNRLVPGGAAEKDGRLKAQDRIIGVGQGENGEIVDTDDMNLNDVVNMVRGKAGTIVRLKIIPGGQVQPVIYNITRAAIELKDSEARSEIVKTGTKSDGTPYIIGWIDLPSFYMDMEGARLGKPDFKSTTRDMRKILDDFNKNKVDAVILDLRRNGGGSLTEAISLTGLFIDEGPVVQVKDADGRVQHYDDLEKGVDWAGPLVVLTSKFSASASEIFAAAIQDYRRGIIVGDHQTHGKGTVQSLLDLGRQLFQVPAAPQLGALKITMQQFYRPAGDSTQERGVVVDVEIPSLTTHLDVGEADLDNHLKFDQVQATPFKPTNIIDQTTVKELQTLSKARCDKSAEFDKVRHKIDRYLSQKGKKSITLNEKKFLDDRAELNADKEEEKELKELEDPNRPVVKKDYYFTEAINVALDFLRLNKVASK